MAFQSLRVMQIHAAENEFAPFNQTVHVVADAHVNHGRNVSGKRVK